MDTGLTHTAGRQTLSPHIYPEKRRLQLWLFLLCGIVSGLEGLADRMNVLVKVSAHSLNTCVIIAQILLLLLFIFMMSVFQCNAGRKGQLLPLLVFFTEKKKCYRYKGRIGSWSKAQISCGPKNSNFPCKLNCHEKGRAREVEYDQSTICACMEMSEWNPLICTINQLTC